MGAPTTGDVGKSKSPEHCFRAFPWSSMTSMENPRNGRFHWLAVPRKLALGPERFSVRSVARIVQRGHEIVLAFAFKFFLGSFETCHARRDFCSLASEAFFLFGHAHHFDLILVPHPFATAIGA
jgi:hypothetical protein